MVLSVKIRETLVTLSKSLANHFRLSTCTPNAYAYVSVKCLKSRANTPMPVGCRGNHRKERKFASVLAEASTTVLSARQLYGEIGESLPMGERNRG